MNRSRTAEAEAFADARIHPLIATKLWENPCWFSFRINYLALRFNGPVYGRIADRHGLSRPEYLVLYSLSLRDGIAAQDICDTAGFPKNTISRAIHRLIRRKLIRRALDSSDRRSFVLHLTAEARRILAESVPPMVAHERRMLSELTPGEQQVLSKLLAKLVVDSPNWPTEEHRE
ncbi:MAG: winged helix-turn-helix transcriptional regulator [Alphaproteobacteria bacterium]|nr:winged helix-turn-helix transcriptional regulator [Alphaproteobacteria bacterium]